MMPEGARSFGEQRNDLDRYQAGERATRYLHPGEWLVSAEPCAVTTILASCVSVCLWDPTRRVGALNHYLLPAGARTAAQPSRYGSLAVPLVLEKLEALGCRRADLRAKIFGGASRAGEGKLTADLGARNVVIAEELLRAEGIPVLAADVGGTNARKLIFHTDDGAVWLWRI
jgi:chemotaxis protein CheD